MHHPSGGLCMTNQSCAQARNIEGCRIVSRPVPETCGIGAAEPGSPVDDFAPMCGGRVGVGGLATAWAHMGSLPGLLPLQAHSAQKALVAQNAPQGSPHLRIVSPVAPPSLCSSPASR